MRWSPSRVAVFLAAVLASGCASPTPALAFGGSLSVCEGPVTVSYSPALLLKPGTATVQVGQVSLPCVGPAAHSVSLSQVLGSVLTAGTCAGPLSILGSAVVGTDTAAPIDVQWTAAGTASEQTWTFVDTADTPPQLAAFGAAAQAPPDTGCARSGSISTVTLTVALVIVA